MTERPLFLADSLGILFATCQIIGGPSHHQGMQRSLGPGQTKPKMNALRLGSALGLSIQGETAIDRRDHTGEFPVLPQIWQTKKPNAPRSDRRKPQASAPESAKLTIFVIVEFMIKSTPSNESSDAHSSLIRLTALESLQQISSAFSLDPLKCPLLPMLIVDPAPVHYRTRNVADILAGIPANSGL